MAIRFKKSLRDLMIRFGWWLYICRTEIYTTVIDDIFYFRINHTMTTVFSISILNQSIV